MSLRQSVVAFVRYAWAAPATLVGVALSLAALALGARARAVDGCLEVAGGNVSRCITLLPSRFRFAAISARSGLIGS